MIDGKIVAISTYQQGIGLIGSFPESESRPVLRLVISVSLSSGGIGVCLPRDSHAVASSAHPMT
jgi:hypothetical protein